MRKVFILPSLFTSASLMSGLMAVISVINHDLDTASLFIIVSALLDGLDGKIARLTNTQTTFGLNYDSISDVVAFGVAPGMLIYSWLQALTPSAQSRIATGVAVLFAVCAALRLARFNVQAKGVEKKQFKGLPSPAAAGAIVAAFLIYRRTGVFRGTDPEIIRSFLGVLFSIVAVLMVSNVTYPSLKQIDLSKRKPFDFLVLIIIIICFCYALWQLRSIMLFILAWGYLIWGLIGWFMRLLWPRKVVESHKSPDVAPPS